MPLNFPGRFVVRSFPVRHLTKVQSAILLFFSAQRLINASTSTVVSIWKEHVFASRSVSMFVMPETAFKSLRTEASQPVQVMLGRLIETSRSLLDPSTFACFFLLSLPLPGFAADAFVGCPIEISTSTNFSTPLNI